MSLKRNITANYISQIYVAAIGVLMLPVYIKYMGAEAYGLVGFFTMLQAWFNMLDVGLTPTISRETTRFHAGSMSALNFRQLFRALNNIFLGVALIGGISLFLLSEKIAINWLNASELPLLEIQHALQIMGFSVALRWVGGMYRGVISGSEQLVWLSVFNIIISTLRFVIVLPCMWYFGFTPFVFFIYQLVVALLEVLGLWYKVNTILPPVVKKSIGWSLKPIKPILKFSLAVAFTSSVWILVTQTDKLILSNVLSLTEYGYFTLAVLVASSIMIISGPISAAIMPRMARLHAEGKHDELLVVYRSSTQLVTIVSGSISLILAFCAEPILFVWTGSSELAAKIAPMLCLYAIGNGFLAVAAFPYYLQYAKGSLRYHLLGNLLFVGFLIPAIIYAAIEYGGIGAGYVWIAINFIYLFTWVGYTHRKIEPSLHLSWLLKDIMIIVLAASGMAYILSLYHLPNMGRLESLLYISIFGLLVTGTALLSSSFFRAQVKKNLKTYGYL